MLTIEEFGLSGPGRRDRVRCACGGIVDRHDASRDNYIDAGRFVRVCRCCGLVTEHRGRPRRSAAQQRRRRVLASLGELKQWRCTRPDLYPPTSAGHDNVTARQGHYVYAPDRAAALAEMARRYPHEEHFTADATEDSA
jgi:hypothetical protein